jgi:acetate---CoA ligase (ADP-forming)
MKRFFEAERVAVIGVSQRPGNLGQRIIRNLQNFDFAGEILPVGPRGGVMFGHGIHKSVLDIPGKVDLAVILTPASSVPDLLEQCGKKGIKRIVIESGGFGEFGPEGQKLSDKVLAIAKKHKMRIVGPNGIGIADRHRGLATSFATLPKPIAGPTSIIAQSGGVGITITSDFVAEHLGLAKFASIGNKIDVGEADLIRYLAQDDNTGAIIAYLESIKDGRKFFDAARACKKPLVVFKSNTNDTSSQIAASHSAAIMSDDRIVDAALKQAGASRARFHKQVTAAAKVFTLPALKGDRLAIVSRSGGEAVIAADHCHRFGLTLPVLPESVLTEIESHLRAGVIKLQNPMDLGDLFDMEVYELILDKIVAQPEIDGILLLFAYYSGYDPLVPTRIVDLVQRLGEQHGKPIAMVHQSWPVEMRRVKEYSTFPVFDSPDEAVWALAQSRDHHKNAKKKAARPRKPAKLGTTRTQKRLASAIGKGVRVLNAKAFDLLRDYGIPFQRGILAKTTADALAAAKKLGYPVAMKIESAAITHKTDADALALGVASAKLVRKVMADWRRKFPKSDGVLFQAMAGKGPEFILGAKRDPQFGPVLLLGWGGIWAELADKPSIRLAPVTKTEALEMIAELPSQRALDGYRGSPVADRDALAEAIVRAGWMMVEHPEIAEMDINPLRATKKGLTALDARIFLSDPAGGDR